MSDVKVIIEEENMLVIETQLHKGTVWLDFRDPDYNGCIIRLVMF